MANISCERIGCDNNYGFDRGCMINIDSELINVVKSGYQICPILKEAVEEILEEVRKSEN